MEKEILSAIETKFAELQVKQAEVNQPKLDELKDSYGLLKEAVEKLKPQKKTLKNCQNLLLIYLLKFKEQSSRKKLRPNL